MIRIALVSFLTLGLTACGGAQETDTTTPAEASAEPAAAAAPAPAETSTTAGPQMTTTASGLQYIDVIVGTGDEAVAGKTVYVHYTGTLDDGTVFDSSRPRNQPFSFQLGAGMVIPGWDEGVAGMRVGGQRRLIIPPNLAYGERGAGSAVPPNARLTFEVELLEVR